MTNLNKLDPEELQKLYLKTVQMRKDVLEFVQEYEQNTNALITQNFERQIEQIYGMKVLNSENTDIKTDVQRDITKIVDQVISEEHQAVEQAKSNPQTINYLVGKVMQKTKGNADSKLVMRIIKSKLEDMHESE